MRNHHDPVVDVWRRHVRDDPDGHRLRREHPAAYAELSTIDWITLLEAADLAGRSRRGLDPERWLAKARLGARGARALATPRTYTAGLPDPFASDPHRG